MAIYKTIYYNVEGRKFKNTATSEEAGRRNLLFALYSEPIVDRMLDRGEIESIHNSPNYNSPKVIKELERLHGKKIMLWS